MIRTRRFALVLLVLLVALTATGFRWFLPIVASEPPENKRGVGLWLEDESACQVLDLLDVGWYYTGPVDCPGHEYVVYVAKESSFEWVQATRYTLLWNEPEFSPSTLDEMMGAFVPYAAQYPDTVWVGPCPAYDLSYFAEFWRRFEQQAGYAMPRERIRGCMHCYAPAAHCAVVLEQWKALGYPVWVTEFGRPLDLDLTPRQQAEDTQQMVAMLEADPQVERYAYWPGALEWGNEVPYNPAWLWAPLAVPLVSWDQQTVTGYALTWAGQVYAGN